MDLERIKSILELPGGPAFAAVDGELVWGTAEAAALGLCPGRMVSEFLAEDLPVPGEGALEARVRLGGAVWLLRATAEADCALCFLRREPPRTPAPNENTLLRSAGSIRLALHEFSVALEALTDAAAPEEVSHYGAAALRSVYRLRRTAEEMELYAHLRDGSYRLTFRDVSVLSTAAAWFGELAELLQRAKIQLSWELPQRDFILRLDWPLVTVLLQGLIANAAANSADGCVRLKLARGEERRLLITVSNRPAAPLPASLFDLHADPQQDLRPGIGLGLSVISAGAACHGGSLLLSADQSGLVTALLSVTGEEGVADINRSFIQIPMGTDADLVALSPVLPPELYRPEELL